MCTHELFTRHSAELKGARKLVRIRPEIFDFETDLGLRPGQTKPKISGTAPTNQHTTIPNDLGPISVCFDDNPKLLKLSDSSAETTENLGLARVGAVGSFASAGQRRLRANPPQTYPIESSQ